MEKEIKNLIKKYEKLLENLAADQMTDDQMPPDRYYGVKQTYENVIEDLKALLK